MGSSPVRQRYCRCGARLAADNTERQCACCARASRGKFVAPPEVPAEFWRTEQLRDAFAAQHMGRVARAYRLHPHHQAVYGLSGISQRLLGQWTGLTQAQISRIETGSPIRNLDTLAYWARTLRIPAELLWFRLPGDVAGLDAQHGADTVELTADPERDPVLVSPWSSRGTLAAAVAMGGGSRVKRRNFVFLTGAVLTAPAHQWLVHEPEPLISGLAGRRVSGELVARLSAMVAELRKMDDVGGEGSVLSMAEQQFGWVTGLLGRASYGDDTSRALHVVLAELGQLCGFAACDYGLAQRYNITALRAAHTADDRPLGAHILGSMARQAARNGQAAAGVTFVETALAGTRGQATPALLAELHIGQALAFATLRDTSACSAAISRAHGQVEQLSPDDDPSWLYWLDPAAITMFTGNCHLLLDQTEEAIALLDGGLAELSELFVRDGSST